MANMSGEIVTIDNFEFVMSKWDPNSSNSLYGLVDMGSNGIRFSISDLSPPESRLLPCIYAERAGISLYDALHDSKPDSKAFHFSSEIISTVSSTLARFRSICDNFKVPENQISVFATEAMRTAENRDEMLGAIFKASGLKVQLLSPAMESLFGAMGARTGFDRVDGVFMDLGGGSVQMTYVNSQVENYELLAAKAATSMPYGAAKVAAFIKTVEAPAMRDDLHSSMVKTFENLKAQFPALKTQAESTDGVTIYFCGGGFRGYGSMLMHTHEIKPYPIPIIGGFTVPGSKFVQWEEMLKVNMSYQGKIYGLSKRRREQFPAIVTVVEALVTAIPNIKQVIFCTGGNREGVLFMKLPQEIRSQSAIGVLPVGSQTISPNALSSAQRLLASALPPQSPQIFTSELRAYIINNTWIDLGDSGDINSIRSLQSCISGTIAGRPGLTHTVRALIGLTMCARWATDIHPSGQPLYDSLRELVGPELSFWCEYIGTVMNLLASIAPSHGVSENEIGDKIAFVCSDSSVKGVSDVQSSMNSASSVSLGKKGKKKGVQLEIKSSLESLVGVDVKSIFKGVGDGTGFRVDIVVPAGSKTSQMAD